MIELGLDPVKFYVNLVGLDGQPVTADTSITGLQQLAAEPGNCIGLRVSIENSPQAPEYWCDISMLHSEDHAQSGALDLRWLFSQDPPIDMAQALQPNAMASRTEAQAQIVSVSPPIPVMDKILE